MLNNLNKVISFYKHDFDFNTYNNYVLNKFFINKLFIKVYNKLIEKT
jgi:hypothetical protein